MQYVFNYSIGLALASAPLRFAALDRSRFLKISEGEPEPILAHVAHCLLFTFPKAWVWVGDRCLCLVPLIDNMCSTSQIKIGALGKIGLKLHASHSKTDCFPLMVQIQLFITSKISLHFASFIIKLLHF